MIDYGYEARLVDRIAANEAIAARLNPRQKRVLLRYTRYGETYREISQREGTSPERIRQLHLKALNKLRKPLDAEPLRVAAHRTTRNTPPPGFDKADFLRHMRLLIELREQRAIWERQEQARRDREAIEQEIARERDEFETERDELARLIAREKASAEASPPPPPPPPKSKPPIPYGPYSYQQLYGPTHTVHNSPSYAPPPLPTQDRLCAIAHEALRYLLLERPQDFIGNPWLGKWCTSVIYTRDGGLVTEAVNNIVRELPAHARLSAYPVPIEAGVLGAHATTPYASLRITVTPDGLRIRLDVTWDSMWD